MYYIGVDHSVREDTVIVTYDTATKTIVRTENRFIVPSDLREHINSIIEFGVAGVWIDLAYPPYLGEAELMALSHWYIFPGGKQAKENMLNRLRAGIESGDIQLTDEQKRLIEENDSFRDALGLAYHGSKTSTSGISFV